MARCDFSLGTWCNLFVCLGTNTEKIIHSERVFCEQEISAEKAKRVQLHL